MGSAPFKCKYKPFRDSDEEIEITWYHAAPGAKFLGKVSSITNPYWERDQFFFTDGDLPLSTAQMTGKPVIRPGTGRGGVCGTDADFLLGGKYEPDKPPQTYGQQGLPSCCGAPVVVAGVPVAGLNSVVVQVVTAGPDCLSAVVAIDGTPITVLVPAFAQGWIKWATGNPFAAHFLRITGPDPQAGEFFGGFDCASKVSMGFWAPITHACFDFALIPFGPAWWLRINADTIDRTYTVTWSEGSC